MRETNKYIATKEDLEALDRHLLNDAGKARFPYLAFDTETNGLLFFRNVVIGFSVSPNETEGYYIPLLEWKPDTSKVKVKKRNIKNQYGNIVRKEEFEVYPDGCFVDHWTGAEYPENVTPDEYKAPEFIIEFLRRWGANYKLVMHNAPFDCNIVNYNMGVDLSPNLFIDTILLKHFLDENSPNALKEWASMWSDRIGYDSAEDARAELSELGNSIMRNGGDFRPLKKDIWRGDGIQVAKYGAKDTILTYRVFKAGMQEFKTNYTQKHHDLFFKNEIMPLCREVVIPMIYGGAHISVDHFRTLRREIMEHMNKYEDRAINLMGQNLEDFPLDRPKDEIVSNKRFYERILQNESLEYPYLEKKGVRARSMAKKAIQEAHLRSPHWLWAHLLGQEPLPYTEKEVEALRQELYEEIKGRRYRFNIKSPDHLRWLLFTKLGENTDLVPKTRPPKGRGSKRKHVPKPSTEAEVLETFFAKKYPFIQAILTYKKLHKLLTSYIEPAIALNNKGWLHLDLKQFGTTSGRFSCSGGFNLQTLPKAENIGSCPKCDSKKVDVTHDGHLIAVLTCKDCKYSERDIVCYSSIKAGFTAPEGYKILNADYSALEPRCFAYTSGDEKLKEIFRLGLDLYSKVYCDMLDPEGKYSPDPAAVNFLKKINAALRDFIKPMVLSVPYGSRDAQVANLLRLKKKVKKKDEHGNWIEKEYPDAEKGGYYRRLYLDTYPDLHAYMNQCDIEATTVGYIETMFGRRRRFEFAPVIWEVLSACGLTIDEFLDHNYNELRMTSTSTGLTRDALAELGEYYGWDDKYLQDKGNWGFFLGFFRNELNNSKNFKIQGLAAHFTNRAMLEYTRMVRREGFDSYIFLQVHDEISCYVRDSEVDLCKPVLKEKMEKNFFTTQIDVPMKAEPVVCSTLKESK